MGRPSGIYPKPIDGSLWRLADIDPADPNVRFGG